MEPYLKSVFVDRITLLVILMNWVASKQKILQQWQALESLNLSPLLDFVVRGKQYLQARQLLYASLHRPSSVL